MKLKNKLTTWISLFVLGFSTLSTVSILSGYSEQKQSLNTPIDKYPNIIPYDFFGDWSNGEYSWTDDTFGWKYKVEPYIGKGMFSFMEYTSSYNKALKNGYDKAEYKDSYYNYIINGTQEFPYSGDIHKNIDGFIGIDPHWMLSDTLKYMEDWIVWNFNEVQNYDDTFGREIKTSDIDFSVEVGISDENDYIGLKDDPKNWLDKKIFEFTNLWAINLLTLPYHASNVWYWSPVNQPKSKKPTYDKISTSFDYEINNIERLILPNEDKITPKLNLYNKITKEEAHNFLKNYDYNSISHNIVLKIGPYAFQAGMMNLAGLEATADKLIFEALNKDNEMTEKYGIDYIEANQRVLAQEKEGYLTNFISTKDYQVNYEVSDDGLNWETKNTIGDCLVGESFFSDPYPIRLDTINYLRVSLTMYDSPRTEAGFISEVFKPREEWGLVDPDPKPDPETPINKKIIFLALSFFLFTLLLTFLIFFFLIKSTNKKQNKK